jgi:hypothetical protein
MRELGLQLRELDVSQYNARGIGWMFEAGGIEAITNDGFANLDDLVEAFKVSGARLVCLCSSNDIYARQATVTATELSKSPGTYVYMAGRPAELEVVLKAAGVRSLIYAGCDVLAVLQRAHAFSASSSDQFTEWRPSGGDLDFWRTGLFRRADNAGGVSLGDGCGTPRHFRTPPWAAQCAAGFRWNRLHRRAGMRVHSNERKPSDAEGEVGQIKICVLLAVVPPT